MATYDEYKDQEASEKVTLVTLGASRRLVEWTLHSGTVYSKSDFDVARIDDLTQDGTSLVEVSALADVSAGEYFNDRTNKVIYLETSDSLNPDTKFVAMEFTNFFSDKGVGVANDLASGFDVDWLPLLMPTGEFGPKSDIQRQTGESLEGSGEVRLNLDFDYWKDKYDKFYWDNKPARVYSWNKNLPPSEAKILFRGRIVGKSWTQGSRVGFKLKDTFFDLRKQFELGKLEDVAGAIIPDSLNDATERLVYGEVNGHRPTSLRQVIPDVGFSLSGTVSTAGGSATLTGSGTTFLNDFSPEDNVIIAGLADEVTIESITSDTSLELSEEAVTTVVGATYAVVPNLPKRYTNRVWSVADHNAAPSTTVLVAINVRTFTVVDATDFDPGAKIFLESQVVTIERIADDNTVVLTENLLLPPANGATLTRISVFDVRINNRRLDFDDHYTLDEDNGLMTLKDTAERDIASTRTLVGTVTFNSTRAVTGTGTLFTTQLDTNSWIRLSSESVLFEVLSIESDTALTLRIAASYSGTAAGRYKKSEVFDQENDVLTVSCLGATDDATSSGAWLKTGPQCVLDAIKRVGFETADIDTASFTTAQDLAPARVGFSIPDAFDASTIPTARDAVNRINRSIFGSIIQNQDLDIEYNVLEPAKPIAMPTLDEDDVLGKFKVKSKGDSIIKDATVDYQFREFDRERLASTTSRSVTATSEEGQFLAKTTKVFRIQTVLQLQSDAEIFASRWSFFLSTASTTIQLESKLQVSDLIANDKILLKHEKLYERVGSLVSSKIGAVISAKRNGSGGTIEIEDLSNALTRACVITENDADDFDDVSDDDVVFSGFITNDFGYINGEQDFGINLIW